ncbi:tail assembly chaperone [Limosilactobacillus vaginalis]|uniref:tail assembly chaperone n=1 Tax=Limosilactobacillus vaginalis TaxID=1633 RepID=UPI003735928E
MELKINDKEFQTKFNFASLSLWEEKIVDNDGNKQDDTEIFDALFTGLVQKNPRTLVNILNGGLAYLGKEKPKYSEVFDAVSNIMGEEDIDKLAQNLMAELTANGFFKGSMKQWINSIERQIKGYDKFFKELKKPAKNAPKEEKERYDNLTQRYNLLKDQSKPLLDEFDKMLKDTEITL